MIIYHVASFYQALTCSVHSKQYPNDKKILFVAESIKVALLNPSILENIFDKVVYVDMNFGLANIDTCQEKVIEYFDAIFSKYEIKCDKNLKIFAAGAHFNFGLYLTYKQIPFYFMEDACGLISNDKHLRNINKARAVHPLLEENGLYDASHPCIQGIVCNVNEQEPGYKRNNLIHFDTLENLSKLEQAERMEILKVFTDVDVLSIPDNAVVMLSQHYANLNMMSYERQALLYGLIFDYYLCGRNILIKKHPYDFMAYESIYPKTTQIKQRFPSEFLPFISDKPLKMIATISSTGIRSLKSVAQEHLELDFEFEQFFEPIHKIYFTLEMLRRQENVKKIYTIGVNRPMIENMCKFGFTDPLDIQIVQVSDLSDIEPNSVVIVDRIDETIFESLDIEVIASYFTEECLAREIFFINSNKEYAFHKADDESVWNNIIPIEIEKHNRDEDRDYELYNDFETETFYVYTKSKEIRKMAVEFEKSKMLDNLKIEMRTGGFETPEQLRISVLEGILDATEQRLLHYIKKCKTLEKELEGVRK